MIEHICSAPYDEVLLRREYHGQKGELLKTIIKHDGQEFDVWFDLTSPQRHSEIMREVMNTPEGKALSDKLKPLTESAARKIAQGMMDSGQSKKGCLLFVAAGLLAPPVVHVLSRVFY